MPAVLPQSIKGSQAPSLPSLRATRLQMTTAVSFPLLFIFPPPLQFFLTASFFQLTRYSVVCAGRPPSVRDGIEGPPPPSPARELRGEDGEVMVSLPLVSIPPHSKFLLTATFSNEITRQLAVPATLPQSIKGRRARCCHTCPQTMPLQAGDGEFVCDCYPPPIPDVSHCSFFQLNCYFVHDAAHPPSVNKSNKSLPLPLHACESRGEEEDGEVSCSFYSPPPFETFSHSFFFQLNCYPVRHASHLPSVGKANKSPPLPSPAAVTVSSSLICIFPPPICNFFSQLLFPK